ncbi:hypothetical protein [Photobacterium lutimaris]|uniref:DUF1090 domain-containing protein n=1 Tax=Photobacterium lutimaris TaxID=388278 RepID=A0A2T3J4F0_9GAMM|nr:hypothetical protein [Photobacterium lutimaris]PSU36162.1 hypothetical protein C9I99_03945 [Photobacterium lutimaris]TDR74970.1 hypothetical protein DFP78_106301 [Photobacterium lutimaris]
MLNRPTQISLLAIFIILFTAVTHAAPSTKKEKCEKINDKITKIQEKMRYGYTVKQGVKYHKQLNKLYKKQFEACF